MISTNDDRLSKSADQTLPPKLSRKKLSASLFMKIVETINQSTTLESLFSSTMEISPTTIASYHNFPSVGAFDYSALGRFYGYNLPPAVEDHYKNYDAHQPDIGLIAVFARGAFMWLSDLAVDPMVVESNQRNTAAEGLKLMGDGICIPLFGPNNRRGYMFVSGGGGKTESDPYMAYQVQAICQLLHLRFCLLIQKLQKQIQLTDREAQVLELVSFGKTNQEIAQILSISRNTVSGYLKAVFIKLDVTDRVSASMRAQSMKIIF